MITHSAGSHKTLKHYKSPVNPATSCNNQIQTLVTKGKQLSQLISTGPISQYGARLAYHTVYLPSIKYPLPESFFSSKTLATAQAQTMGPIIDKYGYNRHTAPAILYAPTAYAGGGFVHWSTLQGEGQITHFLKHWQTNSMVSRTLRINLAWNQWQSGTVQPILEDTHRHLPHLESQWLVSLRLSLSTIQGSITTYSGDDIHIMDHAISSGLFNSKAIPILNYCRLYLHVTTILELFDADGYQKLPKMFQCVRPPWFNPKTYTMIQHCPSN